MYFFWFAFGFVLFFFLRVWVNQESSEQSQCLRAFKGECHTTTPPTLSLKGEENILKVQWQHATGVSHRWWIYITLFCLAELILPTNLTLFWWSISNWVIFLLSSSLVSKFLLVAQFIEKSTVKSLSFGISLKGMCISIINLEWCSHEPSSSSSVFPSYISGVHHFWVRFLRMWLFFNPTIKVVTFRLRGWCVLGVFLLPAFTRLGHERQDLLRWNACVHRLDLGLYSHPKEFWGEWSLNPC